MNKLPLAKRVQILSMLCEGSSMRSISRVADVSINSVYKALAEAGPVCTRLHDETVRGVTSRRIQCDEVWSFVHAKQKNVPKAKAAPEGSGDVWTWTALDADSKLILTWKVGGRDASYALELMDDLRTRITTRVQLTTDGHRAGRSPAAALERSSVRCRPLSRNRGDQTHSNLKRFFRLRTLW